MRLPADAALIVTDESNAEPLLAVWREERLPIFHVNAEDSGDLEPSLEAIGATTLVMHGAGVEAIAEAAAAQGFRVFVVADKPTLDPGVARTVSVETAVAAARRARFRERWLAARRVAVSEA
jgi:hypothetical protein